MIPRTLAQRLRYLIDHAHNGSVNAAATAIGIPQQTLAQIVSGQVKSPRAGALERIARYFRVPLGWLQDGRGEPPKARPMILRVQGVVDVYSPDHGTALLKAAGEAVQSRLNGREIDAEVRP